MTEATRKTQDSAEDKALYVALELSKKSWKLGFSDGGSGRPRVVTRPARDWERFEEEIAKAKARFNLADDAPVRSCYEAGRDGFWIDRVLRHRGIENIVVDPASIEVNRRSRRAKTDRLDAMKLVMQLIRHHRGEHVWSVVRVPEVTDDQKVGRKFLEILPGLRQWDGQPLPTSLQARLVREHQRLLKVEEQIRELGGRTRWSSLEDRLIQIAG